MPKDNHDAKPRLMTMAEVLADMRAARTSPPVELSDLPPLYATEEIPRTPRTRPIHDLSGFVKLWMLIGEGNVGKTVVARLLIEKLIAHDRLGQSMVAALAPGTRNLSDFNASVYQPPSVDVAATADWAAERLAAMQALRWGGVWDFGGGDTTLRMMVDAQPDMVERSEQEGMAIVAAYLFSPRLDDLAFLRTFERTGFRPRATALILNLGRADSPSAFNDIRNQPEYEAAIDRGAVELWLPPLKPSVARAIEKARVSFAQARDGEAPDGRRAADISPTERVRVREWLMRTEAEFADIEKQGWMPWT
jgi:hypothetical protein